MKYLLLLTLVISSFSCATTKINSGETTYKVEGVNHTGYIASKVNKGEKKPGIIIVHEWWGHNEYARSRADMLADLGYVAMSIDMYGEGKLASHPKDAGSFAMKTMSNPKLAKEKFETALAILKSREDVDQSKIAAIGYCFGGGVVLAMARSGVDLDLIASFHGSLKTAAKVKKGQVKGEVLVFNGESDPMVTKDDIKNFKDEMKEAKVDFEFYNYKNAKHAFTNKNADKYGEKFGLPLGYNKDADQDSWKKFIEKLKTL